MDQPGNRSGQTLEQVAQACHVNGPHIGLAGTVEADAMEHASVAGKDSRVSGLSTSAITGEIPRPAISLALSTERTVPKTSSPRRTSRTQPASRGIRSRQ